MYDMEYYTERLACSIEDKREALKTVEKLFQLASKARKTGLLVLEEEVEKEEDLFLRECVLLVVDATYPEKIRKTMEAYLVAGNHRAKEFLEKVLVINGVLEIQQGANPNYLVRDLGSWFGIDFLHIYKKETEAFIEAQILLDSKKSVVRKKTSKVVSESPYPLFDDLYYLHDYSMQRILRDLDEGDIAMALKVTKANMPPIFMRNMSTRVASRTVAIMEDMTDVDEKSVVVAQKGIVSAAIKLYRQGEIAASNLYYDRIPWTNDGKSGNLTSGVFPDKE